MRCKGTKAFVLHASRRNVTGDVTSHRGLGLDRRGHGTGYAAPTPYCRAAHFVASVTWAKRLTSGARRACDHPLVASVQVIDSAALARKAFGFRV